MKVYVVTASYITEDDSDSILRIFDTYEKANDFFLSCILAEQASDWFNELPDRMIEIDENWWCAYESGNYLHNHSQYCIEAITVE